MSTFLKHYIKEEKEVTFASALWVTRGACIKFISVRSVVSLNDKLALLAADVIIDFFMKCELSTYAITVLSAV